MDGAKAWYRYLRGSHMRILVGRRLICIEAFSRESVEQIGMKILVEVRSDFPEIWKTSKGRGFLGNTN